MARVRSPKFKSNAKAIRARKRRGRLVSSYNPEPRVRIPIPVDGGKKRLERYYYSLFLLVQPEA